MTKHVKTRKRKIGRPPGTLVFVGEQKTDRPLISVMDFTADHLDEREVTDAEQIAPLRDRPGTSWINVTGIHDIALLERFGATFGIHPLTLEDIVNTAHRPKVEEFDTYLYLVMKMLHYDETKERIISEQISLILGSRFLVSFQEAPGDVFDSVRERIRKGKGRIRNSGCDYLTYALIDAVVDNYYLILEQLGEQIENLEGELLGELPGKQTLQAIHHLRREALHLRKQIWPLREMVGLLSRGEFERIQPSTHVFLVDVYDHVIQVLDTVEIYRDMLGGLLELYMSTVSNRMNEVMKVLTIIATIFIPMTFVAGIYGMNFDHMPELHWRWGYAAIWAIVAAIAIAMLVFFKRKKWI